MQELLGFIIFTLILQFAEYLKCQAAPPRNESLVLLSIECDYSFWFYRFSNQKNAVDAASNGATQSIKIISNICANLIAFLSILSFTNGALTWFGQRVNIEKLTFEVSARLGRKQQILIFFFVRDISKF